jgi:hypothetical protein
MRIRAFTRPAITSVALVALILGAGSAAGAADCEPPPKAAADRPDPTAPTEVKVGLFMIDLRSIRDAEQSFTADFHVALTWSDPRLVADPERSLAGCTVPLSSIWHPRAAVLNERSLEARFPREAMIDEEGGVLARQRFVGELTFSFALREYPFDSHRLRVEIISMGYTTDEVAFVVDPERSGRAESFTISDWSVLSGSVESDPFVAQPMGLELSRIVFLGEVERLRGVYLWKVLLSLCLIVAMSWASFWIDPTLIPPRIGIATSAVLTLIAFQFSLGYLLPRLSYLTRADRFTMGATVLVFLAFGFAVATSHLAGSGRAEIAAKINRHCRWVFPVGLLLVLLVAWKS